MRQLPWRRPNLWPRHPALRSSRHRCLPHKRPQKKVFLAGSKACSAAAQRLPPQPPNPPPHPAAPPIKETRPEKVAMAMVAVAVAAVNATSAAVNVVGNAASAKSAATGPPVPSAHPVKPAQASAAMNAASAVARAAIAQPAQSAITHPLRWTPPVKTQPPPMALLKPPPPPRNAQHAANAMEDVNAAKVAVSAESAVLADLKTMRTGSKTHLRSRQMRVPATSPHAWPRMAAPCKVSPPPWEPTVVTTTPRPRRPKPMIAAIAAHATATAVSAASATTGLRMTAPTHRPRWRSLPPMPAQRQAQRHRAKPCPRLAAMTCPSNAERVAQVQAAIAAEPRPIHVPRERPPTVVVDEGPLILVETRKDLRQMSMPFDPPSGQA